MRRRTLLALMSLFPLGGFTPAESQTSGTINVTRTIIWTPVGATITAEPLDLGTVTNGGDVGTGESVFSVTVTAGIPFDISLDLGLHPWDQGIPDDPSVLLRTVANGGSTVPYHLFQDQDRAIPWGDGIYGGARVYGVGTGEVQNFPVYGIAFLEPPFGSAPGIHTDIVTATVNF